MRIIFNTTLIGLTRLVFFVAILFTIVAGAGIAYGLSLHMLEKVEQHTFTEGEAFAAIATFWLLWSIGVLIIASIITAWLIDRRKEAIVEQKKYKKQRQLTPEELHDRAEIP